MSNSVSHPMGFRAEDPTVKAQLFTWSSQEFQNEYALVYTSRSNPALTCLSCIARNHDKVRFILDDCLCAGNKVRIGIEFEKKRYNNGLLAFGPTKIEISSGSFTVQNQKLGSYFWKYHDQFQHRSDQLWLRIVQNGSWEIHFNTRCEGMNTTLAYIIHLVFNRLKGLDVNLSYPHFEYVDLGYYYKRPVALCHFDFISGMPPHDVLKHANVVPNSGTSDKIGKQAKQSESGEEKQENNNDGAPLGPTQNNVIVNNGIAPGILNGSTININI
ncbi:hypothetical protein QN277_022978 [Acacia crassicarpa]|uniref:Uncharacterized protein n=1 Tax=Acacia crassicarpa TaxID=499986 RepID=A0AAE1JGD3_9FABA|nr:hypothetical protein QN277_022978 [Acacia crassicarpa]